MIAAVMFVLGTLFGGLAGFAIGAVLYDGGTRIRRPRRITLTLHDRATGQLLGERDVESATEEHWN